MITNYYDKNINFETHFDYTGDIILSLHRDLIYNTSFINKFKWVVDDDASIVLINKKHYFIGVMSINDGGDHTIDVTNKLIDNGLSYSINSDLRIHGRMNEHIIIDINTNDYSFEYIKKNRYEFL